MSRSRSSSPRPKLTERLASFASFKSSSSTSSDSRPIRLPLCFGHRGASAAYPENTLASFEAAIRDGAEGIESDVHCSADNVLVMFHDAYLNRTTNGTGLIKSQNYNAGIDLLRTTKVPEQPVPTFAQTIELIMRPENRHVIFNIDVKLDNDPNQTFKLIHDVVSAYEDYEILLGPRLVLGLWHPSYIESATRILPYCRLAHIGVSPAIARKYFWENCYAFSMNFSVLATMDGEKFRKECKDAGKELWVWTVNSRDEMIEATRWGAQVILTDKTAAFFHLRGEMQNDWEKISKEHGSLTKWKSLQYYAVYQLVYMAWETFVLTRTAGPLVKVPAMATTTLQTNALQA